MVAGPEALPSLLGWSNGIFKYSGYWVNRFENRFTMEFKTERRGDRQVVPVAQGYTGHLLNKSAAFRRSPPRTASATCYDTLAMHSDHLNREGCPATVDGPQDDSPGSGRPVPDW